MFPIRNISILHVTVPRHCGTEPGTSKNICPTCRTLKIGFSRAVMRKIIVIANAKLRDLILEKESLST